MIKISITMYNTNKIISRRCLVIMQFLEVSTLIDSFERGVPP
jgi:hypothetical protein